jgi:hypothetical protein
LQIVYDSGNLVLKARINATELSGGTKVFDGECDTSGLNIQLCRRVSAMFIRDKIFIIIYCGCNIEKLTDSSVEQSDNG